MNDSSSTNTILIVVLLIVVIGALVWFFSGRGGVNEGGADLEVNVPTETPDVEVTE